MSNKLVRPLQADELIRVVEYFHSASDDALKSMGVLRSKFKPKEEWEQILLQDHSRPLPERENHYIGWEYDGVLIGHSSINQITWGEQCNIHLHIWDGKFREKGLGLFFFKKSVNFFFGLCDFKVMLCEPYAENPAPNRLLTKLGLEPTKRYKTIPGAINHEQFVNQYKIYSAFDMGE
ncbi:MAG: GNAT family N-acetyltransferase [candidate division Zixibacteria bacterium]